MKILKYCQPFLHSPCRIGNYRYEKWAVHVAGVASVDVAGIENVDFGYIVKKVNCCLATI